MQFVHCAGNTMRRLENEEEEKFWEAWIKDDLVLCYRYGKIGSAGHTKLKKFKTRAEVEAELEEKLAEKLEEGFEEPGAEEADQEAEAEDEGSEDGDDDGDDESEDKDADAAAADDDAEDDADDADADDDDDDDDDQESEGEDEESGYEDEDEDEKSGHEDDAPRKRSRATAPVVVEEPPPKPSLPTRVKPARLAPAPESLDAAVKALEALRAATASGSRSWQLARLARRARKALEALGGAELAKHEAVERALDVVTAAVIAPTERLPLEDALTLLWVVDVATFARVIARWRAKMLDSTVTPSIGVLAAALEGIPDCEVAVHVGTALVNRRLSPEAFQYWFSRLKPFLVEALATTGGFDTFRASLLPGKDAMLKARVAEVVP